MDWLTMEGQWIGEWVETVLWAGTWLTLLGALILEGGRMVIRSGMRTLTRFLARRSTKKHGYVQHAPVAMVIFALALPGVAAAGQQGWWWGSPINPGFDKNTVVQVQGTASQVDIAPRSGPSTVRLDTSGESVTVMLGPGWYLAELRADIRPGDPLIVEGSKMMDRRGNLHLVAATITNQRTGAVLTLRDETGRPVWMSGRPSGRM
jgi:hypothetical protein